MAMARTVLLLAATTLVLTSSILSSEAAPPPKIKKAIEAINKKGPYLGVLVPNAYELIALEQNKAFFPSKKTPYLDIFGRRFHVGTIENKKVIIVMTGLATINAGMSTSMLLDYFEVTGVVMYGIAGGLNDALKLGDVTVSKYWAHTGLWSWQRYGLGPNDTLPLEPFGDFTRKLGSLDFGKANVPKPGKNLLNAVWYQPEEVFPVTGTPEVRGHKFWFEVDKKFFAVASKLASVKLDYCLNMTTKAPGECLDHVPKVVVGTRGIAASTFLDNAYYRNFLFHRFKASSVDMETHAAAMITYSYNVPFIAFRALSDLAGGDSDGNSAGIFFGLASRNAAKILSAFIKGLP